MINGIVLFFLISNINIIFMCRIRRMIFFLLEIQNPLPISLDQAASIQALIANVRAAAAAS